MFLQQASPSPLSTPPPSLTSIAARLRQDLPAAGALVFEGLLVFAAFWLAAAIGRRLIAVAAPRVKADTSVVLLLSRLYYHGVLVFGAITALGTAGLNVSALVAGLGLTGFALGFALKDVLSNFVSGVMLLAYRPFHLGDVIEMGEFAGTIESVRIRDTLVRGEDGRLIIIPNTKLITEVVINHTDARPPARPTQVAPPDSVTPAAPPRLPTSRRRAAVRPKDEEEDEPPPVASD